MPWCVSICQLDTEHALESYCTCGLPKRRVGSKKNNEPLVELQVCFWSRMFWSWDLLQTVRNPDMVPSEVHGLKKSSIFPHCEKAVCLTRFNNESHDFQNPRSSWMLWYFKNPSFTLGFQTPCEEVFGPRKPETYLKHLLRRYLEADRVSISLMNRIHHLGSGSSLENPLGVTIGNWSFD